MNTILYKQKIQPFDRAAWAVAMIILASLAFFMLARDARKQYGAVAFGVFPSFEALDSHGRPFDQHRLHGQLSAIIVTEQPLPQDIYLYLHKLSQVTARGKKNLKGLVLVHQSAMDSDQWIEYMKLDEDDFKNIRLWKEGLFKDGIILVDQNGVVRGVFNLQDKWERMNFEGAVKAIL